MSDLYIGAGASCEYALETSYANGDAPDTALEMIPGETMREETEPLRSAVVFGSRSKRSAYQGSKGAAGSIPFYVNADSFPQIVYALMGAEAAAAQVDATTAYDHDFTPAAAGTALPSLNFRIDRGGTVCEYPGCTVNQLTLNLQKGAIMEATIDLLGEKETDDQSLAGNTLSTKNPFVGDYAKLQVDTSDVAYAISGQLVFQNFLAEDSGYRLSGDRYRDEVKPQEFMVSGNFELEWSSDSDALRDAIKDNTDVQLTVVITHETTIEAGYYYTITVDIPVCKLIGDLPVVSARERIPFTINFESFYDATNICKITLRDANSSKWSES